jgi:malate permease and related proteins
MIEVIDTIYNVIMPVFLAIGVGVIYGHFVKPDPKILSGLVIYIFAPAIVLEGMTNAGLNADELAQIAALIFTVSALMSIIGFVLSRLLQLNKYQASAFMLSVVLFNGATYGIPFNEFAFGLDARQLAIVFYSITVLVTNTLGVYLASRGTSTSTKNAILNIIKLPAIYAAFLGLFLNFSDVALVTSTDDIIAGQMIVPLPLGRTIHQLANASVPLMAILLGIQFNRSRFKADNIVPVLVASATSLIIAPLVAASLVSMFGLDGLTRQVGIMQFAMPTAIITTVLTTQFGGDTEFVAATVMVSTIGSILSLGLLLLFI